MLQDQAQSEANYSRFLSRIVQSGTVWGLKSQEHGWAYCLSNESESRRDVYVFWSDQAYAARLAKDGWRQYKPHTISLEQFQASWLPGMEKDGALVGPNWDANLCGLEVKPSRLAQEILRLLKET
jgi:hypothetical protein